MRQIFAEFLVGFSVAYRPSLLGLHVVASQLLDPCFEKERNACDSVNGFLLFVGEPSYGTAFENALFFRIRDASERAVVGSSVRCWQIMRGDIYPVP